MPVAGVEPARISIHSPHARGDVIWILGQSIHVSDFNPLPSCEGRLKVSASALFPANISIHSPHARGDRFGEYKEVDVAISIHSPHARGDRRTESSCRRCHNFNPLPSYEGRRQSSIIRQPIVKFQSTPLMRGETGRPKSCLSKTHISIHSPHARGDQWNPELYTKVVKFQSTPLMRGETRTWLRSGAADAFQSTPLMRGETFEMGLSFSLTSNFNPLPSCEGRRWVVSPAQDGTDFNPLPSCEGRRETVRARNE